MAWRFFDALLVLADAIQSHRLCVTDFCSDDALPRLALDDTPRFFRKKGTLISAARAKALTKRRRSCPKGTKSTFQSTLPQGSGEPTLPQTRAPSLQSRPRVAHGGRNLPLPSETFSPMPTTGAKVPAISKSSQPIHPTPEPPPHRKQRGLPCFIRNPRSQYSIFYKSIFGYRNA